MYCRWRLPRNQCHGGLSSPRQVRAVLSSFTFAHHLPRLQASAEHYPKLLPFKIKLPFATWLGRRLQSDDRVRHRRLFEAAAKDCNAYKARHASLFLGQQVIARTVIEKSAHHGY